MTGQVSRRGEVGIGHGVMGVASGAVAGHRIGIAMADIGGMAVEDALEPAVMLRRMTEDRPEEKEQTGREEAGSPATHREDGWAEARGGKGKGGAYGSRGPGSRGLRG